MTEAPQTIERTNKPATYFFLNACRITDKRRVTQLRKKAKVIEKFAKQRTFSVRNRKHMCAKFMRAKMSE